MLKRSVGPVALYLLGLAAVFGWALWAVLAGNVDRENLAAVIVLPLAWTLGFWPTVAPLLVAWKIWRLQRLLEEMSERRAMGLPSEVQVADLEDTLTLLAAQENHIPERWARRIVRLLMSRMQSELRDGDPDQATSTS